MLELLRDDNVLLDKLQWETFEYFLKEVNPANGLIADKTRDDWPASIAATGLALAAYPIGVERGFMTRDAAVRITLTTLRFLRDSPQGTASDATGYKGFYYHFLDMKTGRRAWRCELSTVDSAFLLAGVLTAAAYFDNDIQGEEQIRTLADELYRRADWRWAQHGGATVTHGYKPKSGFLKYRWEGYDEALLLYILGLGSPTYPLPEESYHAWLSTYVWKKIYDYEFVYAGPLFIHQLSHIWVDFRGIRDAYMRDKGLDYFENSRRATYVQREYAIHNPLEFALYDKDCWGITASDGPGPATLKVDGVERQFFDYVARGVPHGPDDGTIAPWAVVASLPFAPEIVLPAVRVLCRSRKAQTGQLVRFQSELQPDIPGQVRQPMGLGVALELWIESGPHRIHDRKPAHGFDLAADAAVSVHRRGPAPGRVQRWLAITVSRLSTWAVSTARTSRRSDACVSLSPAKN